MNANDYLINTPLSAGDVFALLKFMQVWNEDHGHD